MRRAILLALLILFSPWSIQAEEGFSLGIGAGLFDTAAWFDDVGDFDSVEAGVQLRWPTTGSWGIGAMAGISANEDSAFWAYLGARRPFRLGSCWNAGPTFAVTYYEQGDGKDLGHELEFRSGLEVFCRWGSGSSLGLEFYHLSNASISDVNPGSNSLWVVYSFPLGR
jgi:hypothetical protein